MPTLNAILELGRLWTYISSINSLNFNEADDVLDELPDDADPLTHDDEDYLICEIYLNTDNYRLCKAKAAYDAVLGKTYASLAK